MSATEEAYKVGVVPESNVNSLDKDKPKIAFHAAMMAIQNFGFFTMYYDIWGATPGALADGKGDPCASTRYACAMMALTCFCVTWLCVGMGYGGYISDPLMFTFYWFAHLIGGSLYTASTVIVPIAHFSDDGAACDALSPINGERLTAVYILHAALYLVYVGGMLSISWFSFLKNLLPKGKFPSAVVIIGAVVFFVVPQSVVYATL